MPGARPARPGLRASLAAAALGLSACRAPSPPRSCPAPSSGAEAPFVPRFEPSWVGKTIDLSAVRFDTRDITMVAFRTADEGWFANSMGQTFHTVDAGRTFEPLDPGSSPLAFATAEAGGGLTRGFTPEPSLLVRDMRWLSSSQGLAIVTTEYDTSKGRLLLTDDGGKTWHARPMPPPFERGGFKPHLEIVGSSVRMVHTSYEARSDDGGRLFGQSMASSVGENGSFFSFLDRRQGWSASDDGLFYFTEDRGKSWTRLSRLPGATREASPYRVLGLLRLTEQAGWIESGGQNPGAYFTSDGGKSWSRRGPAPRLDAVPGPDRALPVVASLVPIGEGVREIFDDRPIKAAEELLDRPPMISRQPIGRRGSGTVTWVEGLAFYDERGRLERTWSSGTVRSPMHEEVRGAERIGPRSLYAWTDHAIARSDDDGASWVRLERVTDDRIARASPANHVIELRTSWHGFFQYERHLLDFDGDRFPMRHLNFTNATWRDWRLSRIEAERSGSAPPRSPISCLASTAKGNLTLQLNPQHIGEGDEWLRVLWNERTAFVAHHYRGQESPFEWPHYVRVDRGKTLAFVASIVQSVESPEPSCSPAKETRKLSIGGQCGDAGAPAALQDELGDETTANEPLQEVTLEWPEESHQIDGVLAAVNAFTRENLGRSAR